MTSLTNASENFDMEIADNENSFFRNILEKTGFISNKAATKCVKTCNRLFILVFKIIKLKIQMLLIDFILKVHCQHFVDTNLE